MADNREKSLSPCGAESRSEQPLDGAERLPLWCPADPARPIAWRRGRIVTLAEFARHVAALAGRLPAGAAMVNLCEDRYHFLIALCAALSRAQSVLLPASRVEQVIAEVESAQAGASYRCDDGCVADAIETLGETASMVADRVAARHIAVIGFTSGSTGQSKANPKEWAALAGSNFHNRAAILGALGREASCDAQAGPWIVATVPPQHMYGMELTVLLPLIGGMAVHAARPLFPADIAQALAQVAEPRVLVSTPLHLRALVESSQSFPRAALIVSATAPLDAELAAAIERRLGGRVLEMFGSTETCVFAQRRTSVEEAWTLYPGVELQLTDEGTLVSAPWFGAQTMLQDFLEVAGPGRFILRGRNTDMIEVAGKRASLADLTRRLLAVQGVRDAVVFQPEGREVAAIRRVAALVVAPGLSAAAVLERLALSIDPAFMPRPLLLVDSLPRNELGKLPREALLRIIRQEERR